MSESQAQSRDELIAERDEIIELLQGEWVGQRNFTVAMLDAFVWAKHVAIAGFGLSIVGVILGLVINLVTGNRASSGRAIDVFLYAGLLVGAYSVIAFVVVFLFQAFAQRSCNVLVDGFILSLSGRKDSQVSLEYLTHYWQAHDEESDRLDMRASLRPLWVGHVRERWELDRYWLYPILIRPMAYRQGQELVRLLDQIATLNNALEKLRESDE